LLEIETWMASGVQPAPNLWEKVAVVGNWLSIATS
jgi:hypothetical protein